MFGWGAKSSQRSGERKGEGERVVAIAVAVLTGVVEAAPEPAENSDTPTAPEAPRLQIDAARQRLAAWSADVGAPALELRRAGQRMARLSVALSEDVVDAALGAPDASDAAQELVDILARGDRDFAWDVPLRDIARAALYAAVLASRGEN